MQKRKGGHRTPPSTQGEQSKSDLVSDITSLCIAIINAIKD